MGSNPHNHDEYLANLDEEKRTALEGLRRIIREAAPGSEEVISYQLPAFRLQGKLLVAYGATKKHCALYVMSSSAVEKHAKELCSYDIGKGTIRFQPGEPLPADLVRAMVQTRMQENAA